MSQSNSQSRAGFASQSLYGSHANEPTFPYQQLLMQADQAMVSPTISLLQHKLREQQKRDDMQRGFALQKHIRNEPNALLNENKENFEEMNPSQILPHVNFRPKLLKDSESEQRSYKDLLKNFQGKQPAGTVGMMGMM
jgi:hypothetical protein